MTCRVLLRCHGARWLVALAVSLVGLVGLAAPASGASTITVGPDVRNGYGTNDGCSLEEAFVLIQVLQVGGSETNDCGSTSGLSWPVTVSLTNNHTYTITDSDYANFPWNSSTLSGNAFPVLSGSSTRVVVQGNGATIERASGASNAFRFFRVENAASLSLTDLTLRNGRADSTNGERGGAVYVEDADLSITGSTFDGNYALNWGGAVLASQTGHLDIVDSVFVENQADLAGGAITADSSTVRVNIWNSTFIDNVSYLGGGAIFSFGADPFNVFNSRFVGNQSLHSDGGAIDVEYGPLFVMGSTFEENQASDYGGAVYLDYSASASFGTSTFVGNVAKGGGAIYSYGDFEVLNSTFSGNSTTSPMSGSAIYLAQNASARLSFVTFADQTGSPALAVGEIIQQGTYYLKNVVLADPDVDECENDPGLTVQTAGAVLADDGSCGSGVTVVPNLRSTLGPLADNGGPTQTHALLPASPAIGAVP
ncbi:MAG: choice-of-anchor Q domain-containing protein, partial [Thermomicrobium sp.]|nr:right-handed parallel beta-helix repeat-containing protein [Thermomicrobium sp.]MDW8007298.1 choice-of-anchor Q domain-containing protein [Thermomicrobium sp.]